MISVTKRMEAAEASGGLQNDNEKLRVLHRAMAVAFYMARSAGAAFIIKNWVARCAAETIIIIIWKFIVRLLHSRP